MTQSNLNQTKSYRSLMLPATTSAEPSFGGAR